jgi:hypothetical protein
LQGAGEVADGSSVRHVTTFRAQRKMFITSPLLHFTANAMNGHGSIEGGRTLFSEFSPGGPEQRDLSRSGPTSRDFAPHAKSAVAKPSACAALNTEHQTINIQHSTRNPKYETVNFESIIIPKPQIPNPKPYTLNSLP